MREDMATARNWHLHVLQGASRHKLRAAGQGRLLLPIFEHGVGMHTHILGHIFIYTERV